MNNKIIFFLIIIFLIFITTISVYAAEPLPDYPELQKIIDFINFIINLIRFFSSSVAMLVATVTGWQALTSPEGSAMAIAKKNFTNAIWALFFIFGGSLLAKFFVQKLYNLLAV